MLRDTQGHVAEPREPTREPRWRECDADAWQGPRVTMGTPGWRHVASEGAGM